MMRYRYLKIRMRIPPDRARMHANRGFDGIRRIAERVATPAVVQETRAKPEAGQRRRGRDADERRPTLAGRSRQTDGFRTLRLGSRHHEQREPPRPQQLLGGLERVDPRLRADEIGPVVPERSRDAQVSVDPRRALS